MDRNVSLSDALKRTIAEKSFCWRYNLLNTLFKLLIVSRLGQFKQDLRSRRSSKAESVKEDQPQSSYVADKPLPKNPRRRLAGTVGDLAHSGRQCPDTIIDLDLDIKIKQMPKRLHLARTPKDIFLSPIKKRHSKRTTGCMVLWKVVLRILL